MNKRLKVYVTESTGGEGQSMWKELDSHGIECTLILDSAVGYMMENIDCVMLGAEGVVESGGIINKVIITSAVDLQFKAKTLIASFQRKANFSFGNLS